MSTIMKINPRGQITIPRKVLKALNIEPGDYIEVDLETNQVILKPRKLIDPSQGWYWSPDWQETERVVNEQINNNQISPVFHAAEEGLKWLDE